MPSIYLHNYFSKDIYKQLKNEDVIVPKNKNYFLIFSQSFDYLFSYNFLTIKKGKNIRKFGHYAHVHKSWDYFKNMIEYMKQNKLYDDGNIGYLYGSLSHYVLDSTFHPYIHYISGRYNKKDKKNTKKYMGNHAINEIMLDAIYYYKNHSKKYYKYKICNDKNFYPNIRFNQSLINNINQTYKITFNKDNMGKIYFDAYMQCKDIYRYLMYDRFNIKKITYKVFDFLTPFKDFKAYSYSHHINKLNLEILNEHKSTWLHPITGEKHSESVDDLYNIAFKKLMKIIRIVNKYFNNKASISDVKKTIGNNSYSTGLDVDIRPVFQYFKY